MPNNSKKTKAQLLEEIRQLQQRVDTLESTVAEHGQTEEKLRRVEGVLKAITETAEDSIFIKDADSRYTFVNPAMERALGRPASELIGKTPGEVFSEEDAAVVASVDEPVLDGESVNAERTLTIEGVDRTFHTVQTPVFDSAGKVRALCGIVRDVTERAQAEEALRASEARFKLLIAEMPNGFALHEIIRDESGEAIDYRFLDVNAAFEELVGIRAKDIIGRTVLEVLPMTERHWIDTYGKVALTGESIHFENYAQNLERHYEVFAFSPERGQFATVFTNITERKHTEEKLRESEEKYRLLADNATDLITVTDLQGTVTYVSPSVYEIRGYTVEEALRQPLEERMTPASVERVHSTTIGAFGEEPLPRSARERVVTLELEAYRKDGSTIWIETKTSLMVDSDAEPIGFLGVSRDITQRKLDEEKVARFSRVLEQSLNEIYIFDAETLRFIEVNRGARENLGYTMEEIRSLTPIDLKPEFTPESFAKLLEPLRAGSREKLEFTTVHQRKDRTLYPVEVHLQLTRESTPVFVTIILDITERKRAEEELLLHSSIAKNMSEAAFLVRMSDRKIVYTNSVFDTMFGFDRGELFGQHVSILNAPTDKSPEETAREIMDSIERHGFWRGEVNNIKKDGTPFWCFANVSLFNHPEQGEVSVSVHRDITERKKAEEELKRYRDQLEVLVEERTAELQRANEQLRLEIAEREKAQESVWILSSAVEQSSAGIGVSDLEGKLIFVNHAFAAIHGYSPEELIGKSPSFFHSPDQLPAHREIARQVAETGNFEGESEHVRRDGSVFALGISTTIFRDESGEPIGVISAQRDITERKQTEQELQESEEKYRLLVETMNEGLGIQDENGRVTFANDAFCEMIGYSQDELAGRAVGDLIAQEHRDLYNENMARRRIGEIASYETVFCRKDGKMLHAIMSPQRLENAAGRFLGSFAVITDITERKHAEEALQRSEQSLAMAQRVAQVGSWDWNIQDDTLRWSDEAYRQFGLEPGQAVPTYEAFINFVHPAHRDSVKDAVEEALDKDKPYAIEARMLRADGTEWTMYAQGTVYRDRSGAPLRFVGTLQDITERKRTEEALATISAREQERIRRDLHDSVGQDLTGLSSMTRSLANRLRKRSLPEAQAADAIITGLEQAIDSVQDAIRGLAPVEDDPLGLVTALEQLVRGVQGRHKLDIRLECEYGLAFEDHRQATELFRIAQEALNNAVKHAQAKRIVIALDVTREQVNLEILDDGVGIGDNKGFAGIGLRVMSYRAESIGADFHIGPSNGGGTRVSCTCAAPGTRRPK